MVVCEVENCGYSVRKSWMLKRHRQHVHENNILIPCMISKCGYEAKSLGYLRAHRRRKHDKVKSSVCHVCPASFYDKSHLRNHLKRSHKDHQSCPECDKLIINTSLSEAVKETYIRQKRLQHTNESAVLFTQSAAQEPGDQYQEVENGDDEPIIVMLN